MKKVLAASLLALAVGCGSALAGSHINMKFKPGEDARFNWASFDAFAKKHDLSGQKLSIFGPRLMR